MQWLLGRLRRKCLELRSFQKPGEHLPLPPRRSSRSAKKCVSADQSATSDQGSFRALFTQAFCLSSCRALFSELAAHGTRFDNKSHINSSIGFQVSSPPRSIKDRLPDWTHAHQWKQRYKVRKTCECPPLGAVRLVDHLRSEHATAKSLRVRARCVYNSPWTAERRTRPPKSDAGLSAPKALADDVSRISSIPRHKPITASTYQPC